MAVTGRFAPSPSGRIHLGNILCCLLAWLSARQKGGRVILRIEDLDIARCPRRYGEQMCRDIRWLGLDWDEGPVIGGPSGPYEQSRRTALYQAALRRLEAQGLVYPCFCTRAELHAASAPHREDGQVVYPGTCRGLTAEQAAERARRTGRAPALRLWVPEEEITFTDGHMGEYREWLPADCGDFLLRRSDGIFAYQLAVVVDDAAMGVTEVVRGADLLASTPRQLLLYRLLGLEAAAQQAERGCGAGHAGRAVYGTGNPGKAGISRRLQPLGRTQKRGEPAGGLCLGEGPQSGYPHSGGTVLKRKRHRLTACAALL